MVDPAIMARRVKMHGHRLPRGLLALAVLLLLLAMAVPAIARHNPIGATVTAVDDQFNPSAVSIEAGTNLLFKNDGPNNPHTLSGTNGLFDGGLLFPGGERVVSTEHLQPGTYQFFCRVHPFMQGTLTVTG